MATQQSDGGFTPSPARRERVGVRARRLRSTQTDAERAIWNRLRDRQIAGCKFRRQHPIGPFFADFACLERRLVVELDGSQHAEEVDRSREHFLQDHGFKILRFDSRAALTETDAVVQRIFDTLNPHPNPLPPSGRGSDL